MLDGTVAIVGIEGVNIEPIIVDFFPFLPITPDQPDSVVIRLLAAHIVIVVKACGAITSPDDLIVRWI
jgi:hypothetical protein